MSKPYIKVVKSRGNTLTLDINEAGKQLLLEAGVEKVLQDYIKKHSDKMSFLDKLKICWNILK